MSGLASLPRRRTLILPLIAPNLDVSFKGWMGGVIYLTNLAKILSDLDEHERPRILVLSDGPIETPVTRALFQAEAVEGIFRGDGYPVTLKPSLFEALIENGQPNMGSINRLFTEAAVVFPILHTVFPAMNGLHWIPDFQHKHLPEMFSAVEIGKRDRDFTVMAYERRFLLLSSESARKDLQQFFPGATAQTYVWSFTSGMDGPSIRAVDPRPAYGLPQKYLFAPNQFWKHKDHITLFRAMKILADRGVDVTLACTGEGVDNRHPQHFDDLKKFVQDAGLQERIRFLGVVPSDTLTQLFRHAAAIVQPSLFEGWSTVVEDAKALGRPLFISDLPVHLEQAVDTSPFHFYPRGNDQALADLLAAHWDKLTPGPDVTQERQAAAARAIREKESARAFLDIMAHIAALG